MVEVEGWKAESRQLYANCLELSSGSADIDIDHERSLASLQLACFDRQFNSSLDPEPPISPWTYQRRISVRSSRSVVASSLLPCQFSWPAPLPFIHLILHPLPDPLRNF